MFYSLRYILTVLVVFIHSKITPEQINFLTANGRDVTFPNSSFVRVIEDLITRGLGCCAVPMFFFISGFILFKKNEQYKVLIQKKLHSLVIPFLLWTFINIIFFVIINGNFSVLKSLTLYEWEKVVLGYGNEYTNPLLGTFWFMRDLIIISLISPIIVFLIKKFPVEYGFAIVILLFNKIEFISFYERIGTGLCFFSLGGYAAMYEYVFMRVLKKANIILLIVLFIINFIFIENFVCSRILVFVSSFIFFKFADFIIKNNEGYELLKKCSIYSFFLYASHFMVFTGFIELGWLRLFPMTNALFQLFDFFGIALVKIILFTFIGISLRKICPPAFRLLNGGR